MKFNIFKCLMIVVCIPLFLFGEEQPKQAAMDPVTKHILKANAFAHNGSYEKALNELTEAIEKDGNHARVYKVRAHVYVAKGDLQKALADLSKVLEIVPESANAWVDRAIVHYKLNNRKQAFKDIKRALELAPNSVFALGVRDKIAS